MMMLSMSCSRLFLLLLLLLLHSTHYSVNALNVGLQFANAASLTQCSRTCESPHCSVPPFIRYGKYCGIFYTGCPGEQPCDALDACCMVHDDCIGSRNNNYFDYECNEQALECFAKVKASGTGKATFLRNQCTVDEAADVIGAMMEELLAGRVIHSP